MKPAAILVAVALCGCAELKHVGGALELQEPKKEPFVIDVGNDSIVCLSHGQVLRYVLIDGEDPKAFQCAIVDSPEEPGRKS